MVASMSILPLRHRIFLTVCGVLALGSLIAPAWLPSPSGMFALLGFPLALMLVWMGLGGLPAGAYRSIAGIRWPAWLRLMALTCWELAVSRGCDITELALVAERRAGDPSIPDGEHLTTAAVAADGYRLMLDNPSRAENLLGPALRLMQQGTLPPLCTGDPRDPGASIALDRGDLAAAEASLLSALRDWGHRRPSLTASFELTYAEVLALQGRLADARVALQRAWPNLGMPAQLHELRRIRFAGISGLVELAAGNPHGATAALAGVVPLKPSIFSRLTALEGHFMRCITLLRLGHVQQAAALAEWLQQESAALHCALWRRRATDLLHATRGMGMEHLDAYTRLVWEAGASAAPAAQQAPAAPPLPPYGVTFAGPSR